MNTRLILRYAFRELMGVLIAGLALFGSAGRVDWLAGWAMIALLLLWSTATAIVILRSNPDLLAERLSPRKGAKSWDTAILSVIGISTLARLIVAGLDQRNAWSGEFSLAWQVTALVVCLLGYALVVWATASNAYFSLVVRLQPERGHSVAQDGPYRFIRHPAYVGTIVVELAAPVLLDSCWALIPGGLNAALFILRTALEDRSLQQELEGYPEYASKVRSRLLPGIW